MKDNISETIAATATLSCTVIQLRILLGADGICDLDLPKHGQNALTYFSVFQFQYANDELERSYLVECRCEAAAAVFAFWPALTYFCHCDSHLNNGLRPHSAYTAVVSLRTTAAFLVVILGDAVRECQMVTN